ncbi:MAG TPA: DUF58 domain-containing protein [Candidatus Methylomirabilis sp.]|nr:DUF58 domain-containing protein [Candidatus Methylomirabilis sp.]
MTGRITRASLSTLSLLSLALLLGVLSGRAELIFASVPLVLRLLAAARRPVASRYTLVHELSASRLFEGERTTVTVSLTAETSLPQIEVFEPLPFSAQVLSGSPRTVRALAAGATARWSYELRFPERGRFTLGNVHLRFWEPSGLSAVETIVRDPKTLHVYPRAAPLRRLPVPLRTQASAGNYVSPLVGDGIELGEIRPFAPGDRVRHVNWRASLRRNRLYVTRYQQERNADVVLMLDTLSQAGTGSSTTLHASLRAAVSLAAAYLARKDRVGLIEYGGLLRWVRPGSGRPHFERLLSTLVQADVTFTYVAKDLDLVPPRVLPPQALVVALSPLLDDRFVVALRDLAGRGFDLIVLVVDPVPIVRSGLSKSLRVDTACRLWALERRIQLADLATGGLRIVEWAPDEPIELALSRVSRYRRPRAQVG